MQIYRYCVFKYENLKKNLKLALSSNADTKNVNVLIYLACYYYLFVTVNNISGRDNEF